MKKKIVILYSIIIVLLILYICSFFKSSDKRIEIKSALLNTKYINQIEKIEFIKENESFSINKQEEIWFLNNIPVESKRINDFLEDFSKIRTIYKVSDKIEKDNSYGLTDGTELKIKYFFRDSKEKNLEEKEIIFGKTDFSQSSRYFMNGKNLNVYEVDSSLEKYLTFSEQLWYEPYIVSKEILNNISYKDIQRIKVIYDNKTKVLQSDEDSWCDSVSKLLDLRHGGKIKYKNQDKPEMQIILEKGDKIEILINIFKTDDKSEYNLETIYKLNEKQVKTESKISLWTYNKIKEIML